MDYSMDTNEYFQSYENLEVHQLMLNDGPRNRAYKQAIFDNKDQIKGKVVLDVGAGTGILSIFCAQAGAKKVYAVEASNVYKIAKEVVEENNFDDVIQVINSRVEDVELPEKVDIIVSEWMGFYLLHEGMLNSVIVARDKFLKPGGLLFPETATLYSAPCSVPSMYNVWTNVDGVSMQTFATKLRLEAFRKPQTIIVAPNHVLSEPEVVFWIDLREITIEDLSTIHLAHVAVSRQNGLYQGICLWFTCAFPSTDTEPVTLSTEPDEAATHWKQTVIVLPNEIPVEEGTPIAYELNLFKGDNENRKYMIEFTMLDADEVEHPEYCQCYMTKCILVRNMLEKYEKNEFAQ